MDMTLWALVVLIIGCVVAYGVTVNEQPAEPRLAAFLNVPAESITGQTASGAEA